MTQFIPLSYALCLSNDIFTTAERAATSANTMLATYQLSKEGRNHALRQERMSSENPADVASMVKVGEYYQLQQVCLNGN